MDIASKESVTAIKVFMDLIVPNLANKLKKMVHVLFNVLLNYLKIPMEHAKKIVLKATLRIMKKMLAIVVTLPAQNAVDLLN